MIPERRGHLPDASARPLRLAGHLESWILDPDAVAAEYATEGAYRDRSVGVRDLVVGQSDEDVLRQRLVAIRPCRLLDVGAGLPELCAWAKADLDSDVVALDSSPRMVELAHQAGLSGVLADMRQLPFADETFDCVVASMCLYHVPDPEAAIAEAARVLTTNGTLLATTSPDDDTRGSRCSTRKYRRGQRSRSAAKTDVTC